MLITSPCNRYYCNPLLGGGEGKKKSHIVNPGTYLVFSTGDYNSKNLSAEVQHVNTYTYAYKHMHN